MRHFTYKTLSALEQSCKEQGASHVRFEHDPEKVKAALGRKVRVGSLEVGNSLAIHPMEGCDGTLDGRPGDLTTRRYERFARGGSKLVWFEATAVREDGRANVRQLWITPENWGDFARLRDRVLELHRAEFGTADDLLMPVQLTHSGRYSVPKRIIAYHNPLIDQKTQTGADDPVITDDELERLEDDFVAAAGLLVKAGFNSVDIKVVHGYLLSEMMGARIREGRYGGTLENRTRFIRNLIGKLKAAFGDRLILCMRMNAFDGIPYAKGVDGKGVPLAYSGDYLHGWGVNRTNPLQDDLTEVKQAVGWFQSWGVQLLNVSLGSPYYNPHIGRPFEAPDEGNYEMPEHPLAGVDRHFRIAGELQRTFPDLPIVGTGYSWLQIYAMNAGAANIESGDIRFVGMGRNSLAYPEFARDVLERGSIEERRVCKTLTYCTYLMRQKDHPLGQWPTGCPPFDKEAYGPLIKEVRAAKRAQAR